MEKPAPADHPVHELIARRWSPRAFSDAPVAREDLLSAPVLLLSMAHEDFVQTGKPNRHAQYDVGQAVAGLSFQATALGLFVHQMAGFDAQAVRERFRIPSRQTPMAAIALGHPGEADALPEPLAAREREPRDRVPVATFTFDGRWGASASFV